VWGLYNGLLLSIERVVDARLGWRPRGAGGVPLTFALVTIGWVCFRASDLPAAMQYLGAMSFVGGTSATIVQIGV
jgi:D-alanyl-lipoteichoic acid acyltransferase DltB (MBOAT superfamily)